MDSGVVQKKLTTLDYCINSNEYNDVIFIGASRVQSHISPKIIDSIAGVKSYCLSINAIGIVEANMVLKKYLQNHPKPKAVFLNIDFNMFYTSGPLNNITDFLPYLNDTLIHNSLSPYKLAYRNKWAAHYVLLQKLFATTDKSKAISFSVNTAEPLSSESKLAYKGYVPRISNWSQEAEAELKNTAVVTYQQEGFDLLKNMVKICKQNSIELVLIYAPYLAQGKKNILNYNEIIGKVKDIASQNEVKYWDYSLMPICQTKKYFFNATHLNYDGSKIYSTQLALDIKNMLAKSDSLNTH